MKHQLITVALYRRNSSIHSLGNLGQAPSILIARDDDKEGELVRLFLDNSWGIRYKKLYTPHNVIVPYMIKETWASIRTPEFKEIMKVYWEHYDHNCDLEDSHRISTQDFMDLDDELSKWLLSKKQTFVQENNDKILEGLYYDMSLAVQLAQL